MDIILRYSTDIGSFVGQLFKVVEDTVCDSNVVQRI